MMRDSDALVFESLSTVSVVNNRRTGLVHLLSGSASQALCGSSVPSRLSTMPRSALTPALHDGTLPWCYHCIATLLQRKEETHVGHS
jgi:hypothetical protein